MGGESAMEMEKEEERVRRMAMVLRMQKMGDGKAF